MKIWVRFLLRKQIFSFLFFLLSFFLIYIAIDFSMNGKHISFTQVSSYYFGHFIRFFDLFISVAFLFSSIKVLIDLSRHKEFLALQMAGIPKWKLVFPFFSFAFFLYILSIANAEYILLPSDSFVNKVHSLHLEDGSEIVYGSFDEKKNTLFDVFWIHSPSDFWHFKELSSSAHFADHFKKEKGGPLQKIESFATYPFPFEIDKDHLVNPKQKTLSFLFKNREFSLFNYKLALPTIPFFFLFLLIPPIFSYSRGRSFFSLIFFWVILFIILRALLDASLILAENQVFSATIAIWLPLVVFLLPILYVVIYG